MTERTRIILGFTLITVLWGSTWLFIKIGLESMPPLHALAFRFLVATMILAALLRLRTDPMPMHRQAATLYVILAVFSYSIPFALIYWSEQYIPSGLASVLFAIYPFVVAIGSHLFLPAERLTGWKVLGIVLGFTGVAVVFWADVNLGEARMPALLAVLASTFMQGSSLIAVKKLGKGLRPTAMTLGGMALSLPILFTAAFVLEQGRTVSFDARGIGSVVYLATFGTVVTFLTYYWLLNRMEAVYLSLTTLATPVFAVFLGAVVLGEALGSQVFLGAGLVLTGIAVANSGEFIKLRNKKRESET